MPRSPQKKKCADKLRLSDPSEWKYAHKLNRHSESWARNIADGSSMPHGEMRRTLFKHLAGQHLETAYRCNGALVSLRVGGIYQFPERACLCVDSSARAHIGAWTVFQCIAVKAFEGLLMPFGDVKAKIACFHGAGKQLAPRNHVSTLIVASLCIATLLLLLPPASRLIPSILYVCLMRHPSTYAYNAQLRRQSGPSRFQAPCKRCLLGLPDGLKRRPETSAASAA